MTEGPSHQPTQISTHDQETVPGLNPFTYGDLTPADIEPKNVILLGDIGVGKSSILNLMAGADIAETSPNISGCTKECKEHVFSLAGRPLRIYDTPGLVEPDMGIPAFLGPVQKVHRLVRSLRIDLVLFCIRGGRITAAVQRNYRLVLEMLGDRRIPLAIVVTRLERENRMEDWWVKNEGTLRNYDVHQVTHACVAAAPVPLSPDKLQESRDALEKMFGSAFGSTSTPVVKTVPSQLGNLFGARSSKKELLERLENRCALSRDEAQKLADVLSEE